MNTDDTKDLMQLSHKLHTLSLRYNGMVRCSEVFVIGDVDKHNKDCEALLKEIEEVLLEIKLIIARNDARNLANLAYSIGVNWI